MKLSHIMRKTLNDGYYLGTNRMDRTTYFCCAVTRFCKQNDINTATCDAVKVRISKSLEGYSFLVSLLRNKGLLQESEFYNSPAYKLHATNHWNALIRKLNRKGL